MWKGTAATLKPKPTSISAAPMVRSRLEVELEAVWAKITDKLVEPVAPKIKAVP